MGWLTKILSSLLFFLTRLISLLPLRWLYGLSSFIAFILKRVVRYRKDVVIQNLSRAFPDLRYKEIQKITGDFYRHFSDVFLEVIKSMSMRGGELRKRFKVENPELLIQYHKQGLNIIGLTGHVSNWEWLSIVPSLIPFPCFTLYKPLRSKTAEGIMTRIRHHFGMKLLPMTHAARHIIRNKNQSAFYIFIGDQSPANIENAHRFNFLNQSTSFFTGGAKLALAINAAVVYISIRKVSRGFYNVRLIPIDTSKQNCSETDILSTYSRLLQDDIISQPSDWLWSHKRWKH